MCVATTAAPNSAAARQVVGVGEPADVVAHHRALLVRGAGDRGPPGVDRHRRREARDQSGHGGDDPVHLLGLGHLGTGPGLDAADIEDVGPFGHQGLGPGVEGVEREGGALVVERVGRAVEDAHDEAPVGQVVAPTAEVERVRRPGRSHQARSDASGVVRRYPAWRARSVEAGGQGPPERAGARVLGPRVSSRSTNSWRAASSSRTRSSSAFRRASTSASSAATFTPLSTRRASAARRADGGRLGNPGQQRQGVGGLAPVDQDPGQGLRRLLMARLELERLAQGGLVAGGHQGVRLAEGREQLLDEGHHLGFGQGADELVGHLAVDGWRTRPGSTARRRTGRCAGCRPR